MSNSGLPEIKLRLQNHFSDGLALVVGAGLSQGEGLPGMPDLAKRLIETVQAPVTLQSHWVETIQLIHSHGLEDGLSRKKLPPELEDLIRSSAADYILEAERSVFAKVISGESSLKLCKLLPRLVIPETGLPIITSNYDRLIELAVETCGLGLDTGFCGKYHGVFDPQKSALSFVERLMKSSSGMRMKMLKRVRVFKPHGSLDWYRKNGEPICSPFIEVGLPRLIITPGENKFKSGYESPFDLHRSLGNEAIEQARKLLIVGYGFNDSHLETHISQGITGGKPTLILAKKLSERAQLLASNFGNVVAIEEGANPNDGSSRVYMDRQVTDLSIPNLWDVEHFVSEVL